MKNIIQRMKNKRSAQSMSGSGKATITRLICRRQWHVLGELLRQEHSIPIDDAVGQPITSDLLVHFACRFQAPTSIVRLVAKTYPESLKCADALGRFPIHVSQTLYCIHRYRIDQYSQYFSSIYFHSRSLAPGELLQKLFSF